MIAALNALAWFQLSHIAECQYAIDSLVLWGLQWITRHQP